MGRTKYGNYSLVHLPGTICHMYCATPLIILLKVLLFYSNSRTAMVHYWDRYISVNCGLNSKLSSIYCKIRIVCNVNSRIFSTVNCFLSRVEQQNTIHQNTVSHKISEFCDKCLCGGLWHENRYFLLVKSLFKKESLRNLRSARTNSFETFQPQFSDIVFLQFQPIVQTKPTKTWVVG